MTDPTKETAPPPPGLIPEDSAPPSGEPPPPPPSPSTHTQAGYMVLYRFLLDGKTVTRPAIVIDVHNPGEPAPIVDLQVFAKPEELTRSFVRQVAWDPTAMLAGTWSS